MAFKFDVNLGHVLIAVPLLVGMTAYFVTDHTTVAMLSESVKSLASDHTTVATLTENVKQLRSDLGAGFKDVKDDTKTQVHEVRTDIASLPNVQAQLIQMNKVQDQATARADQLSSRLDQTQRTNDIQDGKISGLIDTLNRLAPMVEQLNRASQIPLGRK
jgi:TolA-binding protein